MTKKIYYTLFLQLIVSLSLPLAAVAQPTPDTEPNSHLIEDIQVTGTQSLDKAAILALAGLRAGDTLLVPGEAIQNAIQRLWKQKLIKDVAIYATPGKEDNIILTIHITEVPRLSTYNFQGIGTKDEEKLLEKIALAQGQAVTKDKKKLLEKIALPRGQAVTDELLKNIQKTIKEFFIEEGYGNTKITITTSPDSELANHVQLNVKIEKGAKLHINAIYFAGNEHLSSEVLKGQMQHIQERPRFTLVKDMIQQWSTLQPLRKGGFLWQPLDAEGIIHYLRKHVILFPSPFSPSKLEEDKKRLISYYQSQGFRDAAIVQEAVYQHDESSLNVWLKVEEGQRYYIGDIRWIGNTLHDADTLNQLLGIKKGDVYNPSLLEQKLKYHPVGKDIASLYTNEGHLAFQIDAVEVGLAGNLVTLEIRMYEGSQYYINKVLIEGNTMTHDSVIRRELRTLPGDKFSVAKLRRSMRELNWLQLFAPINEMPGISRNDDNTVDISYKVKEKLKLGLQLSGGWQPGENPSLTVELNMNNFSLSNLLKRQTPLGEGQALGLEIKSDRKHHNYSLQFTEPWLGGVRPTNFYVSVNGMRVEKNKTWGGSIGLSSKLDWLDDYMVLRRGISFRQHTYKEYELLKKGAKETGTLVDLSTNIAVERNNTNNPLYPTAGSRLRLNASITPPWSALLQQDSKAFRWKEYHQWTADSSYFWNFFDDWVLHVRGQFGILGKFPTQSNVGPFERFYLGGTGAHSHALKGKKQVPLRGYKDGYFGDQEEKTGYQGGVIYDRFVVELRYPITSNDLTSIYALGFAEGGNNWAQHEDFNPFQLKKALGFGLRVYVSFIGTTLGLDWGYGLDKAPKDKGDDKFEFHFSFGPESL